MPIRAVLFDKAGTLVDVAATLSPAFDAILRELAHGDEDLLRRLAAAAGFDLAARRFLPGSTLVHGSPRAIAEVLAPNLGIPVDGAFIQRVNALAARESGRYLTATPGAIATIAALKARGYRIGVSTNTAADHARAELDRIGILAHLDFLAGFNSGFGSKPEPGHVRAFAKAVEVDVGAVACVGDTILDLQAARSAGAVAIGMTSGASRAEELASFADHLIAALIELPPLLERLARDAV